MKYKTFADIVTIQSSVAS